jgi:Zn-dependent peptidase ImmA (M78 family)
LTSAAGEPWHIGERAARALRSELGLGDAPIDIRDVIRRRGVTIAIGAFPSEWGDGRYIKKGDRYLILLNASAGTPARARFTAAHELGHHELHRDNKDVVVFIDTDVHSPTGRKPPHEREADAFAAYLLAPTEALRRDLAAIAPKDITPDAVFQLMKRYGLSYKSLVFRLHNANIVSATIRNRLLLGGEGRVHELQEMYGPREDDPFFSRPLLPPEFRRAALQMYAHRHITLTRLAELLRISESDAQAQAAAAGVSRDPGLEPDEAAVNELVVLTNEEADQS